MAYLSMAYRDELEALRAHVERLESENAGLARELAELRGAPGPEGERPRAHGWLGGPLRLEVERSVEGELPRAGHEQVVEVLRARFGMIGETTVLGSTLTWKVGRPSASRTIEVTITARDGRTRVRAVERLGDLAGGLFGGVVGGAGGGGLGAVVPLGVIVDPLLAIVLAPAWLGAVYAIVRAGYRRVTLAREREIQHVVRELDEAIRTSIAQVAPRVRVADGRAGSDDETVSDDEIGIGRDRDAAQTTRAR